MFVLSTKTEYGLLILEYLKGRDEFVSLSQIQAELGLPQRFAARITADLTRCGLLESREGRTGGYRLSNRLGEFSLFDFLQIFERIALVKCSNPQYRCIFQKSCQHRNAMRKIEKKIIKDLKKYKLSSII